MSAAPGAAAAPSVTRIATKQDLSRWTRVHADTPINWSVQAGEGGTMIIIEHASVTPGIRDLAGTAVTA